MTFTLGITRKINTISIILISERLLFMLIEIFSHPMRLNLEESEYSEDYRGLFTTTGKIGQDEGIDFT